jgi:uncharacterized membrane protein
LAAENKKTKDQLFQILSPKNEQIFASEKNFKEPNQEKSKISLKKRLLFCFRLVALALASIFIVKYLIDAQSVSVKYINFYIVICIGIFPPIFVILTWINFFKIRYLASENKKTKDPLFQILSPKNEQIFASEKIFKELNQEKPKISLKKRFGSLLVLFGGVVLYLGWLWCWFCVTFLLFMMQGINPGFKISIFCTFIEVFITIWLILAWINFFKIRYLAKENKKNKDQLFQILSSKNEEDFA